MAASIFTGWCNKVAKSRRPRGSDWWRPPDRLCRSRARAIALARQQCKASGIELESNSVKARAIGDLRENFWEASVLLRFPPEKISQRLRLNGPSSAERP